MPFSRREFFRGMAAAVAAAPLLTAATRPGLLVWLVAEQFRPDYLDEMWPSFGPGGFRRLVEGGSYFPNCHYDSATFTSSGLATLLTGTWPAMHGVPADRWFETSTGQPVAASAGALRSGTLFDTAVTQGRNRVFLAGSGSGASFLQGCRATDRLSQSRGSGRPWKAATRTGWLPSGRPTTRRSGVARSGWRPTRRRAQSPCGHWKRATSPPSTAGRLLRWRTSSHWRAKSSFRSTRALPRTRYRHDSDRLTGNAGARNGSKLTADARHGARLRPASGRVARSARRPRWTRQLCDRIHGGARARREGAGSAGYRQRGGRGRYREPPASVYDAGQTRRNYVEAYLYPFVYLMPTSPSRWARGPAFRIRRALAVRHGNQPDGNPGPGHGAGHADPADGRQARDHHRA